MLGRSALVLFALVTMCDPMPGDPDGSTSEPDAWTPSGDPSVELGTGRDSFEAFEDGDTLQLVAGCQGAQHIWTSVRAWGLDPRGTILDVSVTRDSDEMLVSQTFRVRVSLEPVAGTDYAQVSGLTVVVPEPDLAIGEALTMRLSVTDMEGRTATDERPIMLEWGESACL
ncbi:MAG: hypothetical protein M5U28_36375 [Sandaracinaceae bacterium]|nr:hypothetical protein [Sandaracinaceae bacterium]